MEELKAAFLDRDFEKANRLISEWGASVKADLLSARDEAELQQIFATAYASLQDTLCLAKVVRAHIATELDSNSASFLYRDAELEQPCWRISA